MPFPERSGKGFFDCVITCGKEAERNKMKYLLTGNEMASADRTTSEIIGIPSIVLMERAALAVAGEITQRFPADAGVTILAGPGNNGADGLAVGRLLIDRGYRVQFLLLCAKQPPADSSAMTQRRILRAYGEDPLTFDEEKMKAFAPKVIVDALFGTGLRRKLTGDAAKIAEAVNRYRAAAGCTVVGLDLPSGISSEDGRVMGAAIKCDFTVTFAYYKRGHFLYPGSRYCGELILRQIGIHDRSFTCGGGELPEMSMVERCDLGSLLTERDPGGNKGTFGKILIVAGSYSMCGAALLCAEACMRSGAGMVKIFTREENRVIIQEKLPEAMLTVYSALPEEAEERAFAAERLSEMLRKDLEWADAAAIGPGVGRDEEARILVRTLLEEVSGGEGQKEQAGSGKDLQGIVIDADALRIIAADPSLDLLLRDRKKDTECILTPHLAEFADLVHVPTGKAAEDRIPLMRDLCGRYSCTVIGKDARTLIASAGVRRLFLITEGNSGMATAGSGDVLTGITAAMLFAVRSGKGRGLSAAQAAALIHALAGDACREQCGERSMIAGDLIREAGRILRLLQEKEP